MHPLPRLALATAAAVAFTLSGCGAPDGPKVPEPGTNFVYEEPDGYRVVLTYKGIIEEAGLRWYEFEQDHMFSFPIENLAHLELRSGGKPFKQTEHGSWENGLTEPFMEWNRSPGKYRESVGTLDYEIVITESGGKRNVQVTSTYTQGGAPGQIAALLTLTYEDGEIVPRTIRRQGGEQPDGTLYYDSTATLQG